ncbi:MAG: addiction module protein [Verrucomicrobia bacterium]|nr:addiction module protein [Verrucomicrobiota bacterium]
MSIAELRNLPPTEKLKIIEVLRSDLAGDEDSFSSPAWRKEAVCQTEAEFAVGRSEVLDWEAAKQELRWHFQ